MTSGARRVWTRITSLLPGRDDLADVRRDPRRDLLAGLTVAIVALPLALGFGVSSGLGAEAGLATAVVAGALAAVFAGNADGQIVETVAVEVARRQRGAEGIPLFVPVAQR